jgi:hypothetical protein
VGKGLHVLCPCGIIEHMFERGGGEAAVADAPPSVSPSVQAVLDAVEAVAAESAVDLPGPQALTDVKALLGALDRMQAVALSRLGDVSVRQLQVLDGAPTVASWVAAQPTSVDRDAVSLAMRMPTYTALAGELVAGRLPVVAGQRVSKALNALRPHLDRPDGLIDGQPGEQVVTAVVVDGVLDVVCEARGGMADDDPLLVYLTASLSEIARRPVTELVRLEDALVLLARNVEAAQLPGALSRLVDAVLPEQLERRAEQARAKRGLDVRLNGEGSAYDVRGTADLELGEMLHAVLSAERAVDPDNPADTQAWEQLRADGWQAGDEPPACGGPRSRRQQRHDALKQALRRYLDSGVAGLREKVAPHLNITVSLATLHSAPGAMPARGAFGADLPASLVRAWWCDSAVTRFVLSLGRKVIETSHTERTLKPHERRAKHVETGGQCQGAGCCHGPGHRLVPHHPDPWAVSGTTSFFDTVMFCEQTHHDLHSGGKTIRLKDGRWLSAAGWVDGPGRWEPFSG